MSGSIKHQYALDSAIGQFVDIEELEEKDRVRGFHCLDCKNVVIPVMGKIQQRHFRHKVDINSSCSGESQVHLSTKIAFFELYNNAVKDKLEFIIEYNVEKV